MSKSKSDGKPAKRWILCRDSYFEHAYSDRCPNMMEHFVKERLGGAFLEWLKKNRYKRLDKPYISMFITTMEKGTEEQIRWALGVVKWLPKPTSVAEIAAKNGDLKTLELLYEDNCKLVQSPQVMKAAILAKNVSTVIWLHKHGGELTDSSLEMCALNEDSEMLVHLLRLRGHTRAAESIKMLAESTKP